MISISNFISEVESSQSSPNDDENDPIQSNVLPFLADNKNDIVSRSLLISSII